MATSHSNLHGNPEQTLNLANSALELASKGLLHNNAFPLSASIVRILDDDIHSIINNIDPSVASSQMDLLFSRLINSQQYEQKSSFIYLALRLATSSESAKNSWNNL